MTMTIYNDRYALFITRGCSDHTLHIQLAITTVMIIVSIVIIIIIIIIIIVMITMGTATPGRVYRSLGVVSDKIASAKRNPVQTGNSTTTTTTTTTTTNNDDNSTRGRRPWEEYICIRRV